jgi:hypothetical protein
MKELRFTYTDAVVILTERGLGIPVVEVCIKTGAN